MGITVRHKATARQGDRWAYAVVVVALVVDAPNAVFAGTSAEKIEPKGVEVSTSDLHSG